MGITASGRAPHDEPGTVGPMKALTTSHLLITGADITAQSFKWCKMIKEADA
jgi:hypothetical protein